MPTLPVPDIETERLILRGPTSADLHDWVACIWGDPDVMRFMIRRNDTPQVIAEGMLAVFTDIRDRHQVGAWVITNKANGQFMGHCVLYREAMNEPELGYALGKAFWGKGYATETARAVARYGFAHANLDRIFATVVPENGPSRRVLEHLGFVYEKDVTHYTMPVAYYALQREQFVSGDSFYRRNSSASS
jgi:ribosomal-protein-alanine N-acetyltransferase